MSTTVEQGQSASWYLLADVRAVQAFIFESDRLAQMRGASRLLLELDQRVKRASTQAGGTVENALGGTYRVALPDEAAARSVEERMRVAFSELTGLEPARFTAVVTEPGLPFEERYERLAAGKRAAGAKSVMAGPGVTRACEVCGWRPAEARAVLTGADLRAVCSVCSRRDAAARRRHQDMWAELGLDAGDAPRDLSALARDAQPPGYIAVIVVDGDRVGEHLRHAGERGSAQLSAALADGVRAGVHAAKERAATAGSQLFPQWVGGDDAVLAVQAQAGLPAAEAFVAAFAERLSDPGVTVCAGVVITHASHPFSALLDLGHQLLNNAKAAGSGERRLGYVDFITVSASVAEDLGLARRDRRARPLAVPRDGESTPQGDLDLRQLLSEAEALVSAGAPRGVIRSLSPTEPLPDVADPAVRAILAEVYRAQRVHELVDAFELARGASG